MPAGQKGEERMKVISNLIIAIGALMLSTGCVSWHSGIRPIEPPITKFPPAPVVSSLTPTLTWESSPLEKSGEVQDLRYHLIVFRIIGFPPKTIIDYDKKDISGTSYRLEKPLASKTRYNWRIRTMYKKKDGQEVVEDWNGFRVIAFIPPWIGWGFNAYFFDTP
jgi:hypothetical protein